METLHDEYDHLPSPLSAPDRMDKWKKHEYYELQCHGEYDYEPLPGPGWIRLLNVYPYNTWNTESLECSIEIQRLHHQNEFGALSYSWAMQDGDITKSKIIYLEGGWRIMITRNLHDALLRVRRPDCVVRMWVDAICINQADIQERNDQVAQMSLIFASARSVTAWLGEEDDEQALCVLECLGLDHRVACSTDHVYRSPGGALLDLCKLRREGIWSTDSQPAQPKNRLSPLDENRRHAVLAAMVTTVSRLLERRYFQRRWIVQEIYHAEEVKFVWGPRWVFMDMFTASLRMLLRLINKYSRPAFTPRPVHAALQILEMRQVALAEGKAVPFHEIVANCSALGCSDPRDIIFALTSLSPKCGLRPDYNLSIEQVCIAFSRCLVKYKLLELLLENLQAQSEVRSKVHSSGEEIKDSKYLPSWVVDLRSGFELSQWRHSLYQPLDAKVNDDGSLTCNIYQIGIVSKARDDVHLTSPRTGNKSRRYFTRTHAIVYSHYAALARKGDIFVAFDNRFTTNELLSTYCSNVLVLRQANAVDSYVLLHYVPKLYLHHVASGLRPAKEKELVRIV